MSLYNLINGVNPATFFILPMLGRHPSEFPRFRDCFVEGDNILVLTRTGGGNREEYIEENQLIREIEGFVDDYDADFDNTYAFWVFRVPERWKRDFDFICKGHLEKVSDEYQEELKRVFPKLTHEFSEIFEKMEAKTRSHMTRS